MKVKDYELIAEVLKNNINEHRNRDQEYILLKILAEDMAKALVQDNKKFDRNKFLVGCGLEHSNHWSVECQIANCKKEYIKE